MKHYLAACCIMKGEAKFIREWILFHSHIGVEHFYLYDNGIVDGTAEAILDVPELKEKVEIIRWPTHASQIDAYQHCLINYKDDAYWIAFIDADEFLFATDGSLLPALLKQYEKYPAVVANWMMYGSAGQTNSPYKSVVHSYTKRARTDLYFHHPDYKYATTESGEAKYWPYFSEFKSIVNPRKTVSPISPHSFRYLDDNYAVDENHIPVDYFPETLYARSKEVSVNKLRINHYWSKSLKDFSTKLSRTLADQNGRYDLHLAYVKECLMNTVEDVSALDVVPDMEQQLAEYEEKYPYRSNYNENNYFFTCPLNSNLYSQHVVSYRGKDFCFSVQDSSDSVQNSHVNGQFYEQDQLEYLATVVDSEGGRVAVDIGSNVGNHALYFAAVMGFGQVFCFEPNPVAASLLRENVKQNKLEDLISLNYLGLALGDKDYDTGFELPYEHNLGAGRISNSFSNNIQGLTVKVVNAYQALYPIRNIEFIKIDVEGQELNVLTALRDVILRERPKIFVEVNDAYIDDFNKFVASVNYEVVKTFSMYEYLQNYFLRPISPA